MAAKLGAQRPIRHCLASSSKRAKEDASTTHHGAVIEPRGQPRGWPRRKKARLQAPGFPPFLRKTPVSRQFSQVARIRPLFGFKLFRTVNDIHE